MRSLPDRFNDRLEQYIMHRNNGKQNNHQPSMKEDNSDLELEVLTVLAHRFQQATPLQVDPDFAQQLERRMLAQNAIVRRKQSARHRKPDLSFLLPRRLSLVPIMTLFCIVLLLGMGSVLVLAAQSTDPNGALYPLKSWEQHIQISLASSPLDQAELSLQVARERLKTLSSLTTPAHARTYHQVLDDMNQQISTIEQILAALPAGADRDRLTNDYTTFKADARHTLYGLLPQLNLPEQLATTSELERVGADVPHLQHAMITFLPHPKNQIIISITGSNISPGVQLLIDNQLVQSTGSFQNGAYVFVVDWSGKQSPEEIGIKNPDSTVARTTIITASTLDNNSGGNDNNNSNGNTDNDHGHGNGKPDSTPTPPHH